MPNRRLLQVALMASSCWGAAAYAADYRALDSLFRNDAFRPTLSASGSVTGTAEATIPGGSVVPASRIVSTIRTSSSYSPQERIVLSFQAASEAE